jgi:hypothetical protein
VPPFRTNLKCLLALWDLIEGDSTRTPTTWRTDLFGYAADDRFFYARINSGVTGFNFMPRNTTGLSTLSNPDPPARRTDGGGPYELGLALLNVGLETQF